MFCALLRRHLDADCLYGEAAVGNAVTQEHPIADFVNRNANALALFYIGQVVGFVDQRTVNVQTVEVDVVYPHMFANFAVFAVLEKRYFDHGKVQGGDDAAVFPIKLAPEIFEGGTCLFEGVVHEFIFLIDTVNNRFAHWILLKSKWMRVV